jgi:hypothetical protein
MSEFANIKVAGRATIEDCGHFQIEESTVRVFANTPFQCAVQIRHHGGITHGGRGGVKRNMMATVQLDRAGLTELRDAINAYLETDNG